MVANQIKHFIFYLADQVDKIYWPSTPGGQAKFKIRCFQVDPYLLVPIAGVHIW